MAAFEFSTHMADVSNQLWAVTSAVGAVACFIVLLVSAVVYTHRASRSHLDRVSFRLVIYALVANMVFGIASAVGGSMTGPGTSCSASIFLLQLTLEISCLLLFCVALNLQLVVVHGIHATKLERYYIGVSVLFGLALTVPPLAAGQYGWDPLVKDCWYTNDNQAQRLAWQIGTQLFWTGLTSVGEVIAATSVLIFMLRVHLRQKHAFVSSHQSSVSRWRFWTSTDSKKSSRTSAPSVIHANAYKTVILRIALYPMASCIINLTSIACVVHATSTNGIQSSHDYSILLLSDFLYGGRAVIYAILAATDPALVRGARSFLAHHLGWCDPYPTTTTMTGTTMTRTRKDRLAVHVELTTISASSYSSTNNDAKQPLEAHEIEMSKHDPLLADSIAERGLVLDRTVASDLTAENTHLAVPQSTGTSVRRSHDLQDRFEKEEQEREEFRRML